MAYCIMEDLDDATEVKIHRDSCQYFVNHTPTTTTRWHTVNDLETARERAEAIAQNYTKGWKEAECCM